MAVVIRRTLIGARDRCQCSEITTSSEVDRHCSSTALTINTRNDVGQHILPAARAVERSAA